MEKWGEVRPEETTSDKTRSEHVNGEGGTTKRERGRRETEGREGRAPHEEKKGEFEITR